MPKLVCIEAGFRSRSLAGRGSGHCGPMGEQYLGHGALLSRPRPTLRLGLKKGGSAEPSRARVSEFFLRLPSFERFFEREHPADSLPSCCCIVKYSKNEEFNILQRFIQTNIGT